MHRFSTTYHPLLFILVLSVVSTLSTPAVAQNDIFLGEEMNPPKRESRAVWITTLGGLDWPKSIAYTVAGRERQKQELCTMLDQLKAININTILLQTRVRGSVIYPSKIEPWDVALTGHYNMNPGYDPLQFAIDECHKRGMELHAWVVTIPAYKIAQAKAMGAQGVAARYPKMVKKHNEMYYLDPGQPATADYLTKVCTEIVKNYDVDGIHFDYIRYPEDAGSFPDGDTYKKYGAGKPKAQWRRDNITRIVRSIYQAVKTLKPWVRVSSSPVGKFRDTKRYSSKGWNCYDAVYQDAQGWLREGIHDALYPMMYFKGDHFFPFAADWREQNQGRVIAPGLGIYFLDPKEKNWPLSDVTNQLHYTRSLGLGGQAFFREKYLWQKGLYDYLRDNFYAYPALTPAATWLDSIAPSSPTNFHVEELADGMARLTWDPATDNYQEGGIRYNVYVDQSDPVNASKAQHLVAAALPTPSYTYNAQLLKANGLHILVTAMDRFGNESPLPKVDDDDGFLFGDFASQAGKYGAVEPDFTGNVKMPESSTQYYAITDLQRRILSTGAYSSTINVKGLAPGWYEVRSLHKKGLSHHIVYIWVR